MRPGGPNSAWVTVLLWPRSTATGWVLRLDQTRAVPSRLAETICSPSLATLASITSSSWRRSSWTFSSLQK